MNSTYPIRKRLFVYKSVPVSSVRSEPDCQSVQEDLPSTLVDATAALDMVSREEFTTSTLTALQTSNADLESAVDCAQSGAFTLTGPEVAPLVTSASNARTHVATAESAIDDILNPSPPGLSLDSPFIVAVMAVGGVMVLAVVLALAVIGARAARRPPARPQPYAATSPGRRGVDNAGYWAAGPSDIELATRPRTGWWEPDRSGRGRRPTPLAEAQNWMVRRLPPIPEGQLIPRAHLSNY